MSGIQILSPQAGSSVPFGTPIMIYSSESHPQDVLSVTYFVNGSPVGTTGLPPYSITYTPSARGTANVRAVAQLRSGGIEEQTIMFTVQ